MRMRGVGGSDCVTVFVLLPELSFVIAARDVVLGLDVVSRRTEVVSLKADTASLAGERREVEGFRGAAGGRTRGEPADLNVDVDAVAECNPL